MPKVTTPVDAVCDDRSHTRSQTCRAVVDGSPFRFIYCDNCEAWVNRRPIYAQERRGR